MKKVLEFFGFAIVLAKHFVQTPAPYFHAGRVWKSM